MKKLLLAVLLAGISVTSYAATDSCAEQVADINAKLAAAKSSGNSAEEARLQLALNQVNTYCTESRQVNRAQQDVTRKKFKVQKAELELESAKNELTEAQADGRASKIAKKNHKVEEKKLKLENAKEELKQAQADHDRLSK